MALIKATRRDALGTRRAKRLRAAGQIPGVVYGHGQPTESITLNEHEVELAILHGDRILEIELDGHTQTAMVKQVQYDTFGHAVLHVDLARVDLDERVEVKVPIVLKGTPIGVSEGEGTLQQIAADVNIECTVRSIPDEIVVMITGMKVNDYLTRANLPLPEGAKLLDDPAAIVASVTVMAEEEAAPVEVSEAAEPEVIGEKPEAEAAEEGEEKPQE